MITASLPSTDPNPCALTDRGPRKVEELLTTVDRLTAWADWFDLEPPPLRYSRRRPKAPDTLLVTDELLTWMILSGGSLDWFLSGDVRPMARVFRREDLPVAEFWELARHLDAVETELFIEAIRDGREGGEALERALSDCQAKVDAHRAAKAEAA